LALGSSNTVFNSSLQPGQGRVSRFFEQATASAQPGFLFNQKLIKTSVHTS
jgi:hypothetical protein